MKCKDYLRNTYNKLYTLNMLLTLCNIRPFNIVNRSAEDFIKIPKTCKNDTDHFQKVNELSKTKSNMQRKLDKQLSMTFTYCSEDKHTPICKIMWKDVHECLIDIDNINQEIKYHKWHMFIEEE